MRLPRRLRHDQTAEVVEHLEELRWRIMVALAAVAVATAVLALVNLGVLTSRTLRRNRRRGYFLVALIALALPGPDPVTTLLELLPMWILFEGSIWLAVLAERHYRRADRLAAAET